MLHVALHNVNLCYCTETIKFNFCLTSTVQYE